jgi:hypothetical protein
LYPNGSTTGQEWQPCGTTDVEMVSGVVMGYETRLDGVLAIEPFPSETGAEELRRMLASLRSSDVRSSAWELMPMGHGLVNESRHGWEGQASHLRKIAGELLRPRGMDLVGRLEAIREDDTPTSRFMQSGTANPSELVAPSPSARAKAPSADARIQGF